jgi:hypothetical protein
VLFIVLLILALPLLLCGGTCGGCLLMRGRAVQESTSREELSPIMASAVALASDDSRVREQLGEPVEQSAEPTRDSTGEISPVHESFQFQLRGPRGTAQVVGHATKVGGFWKITTVDVQFSGGDKITITPPADAPPELNFDLGTEAK